MYSQRDPTRLMFALGSFEALSIKPLINEPNVLGVMLSVVIHMEVLGLNELIFLASGVLSKQAFACENTQRRIQTICFPD